MAKNLYQLIHSKIAVHSKQSENEIYAYMSDPLFADSDRLAHFFTMLQIDSDESIYTPAIGKIIIKNLSDFFCNNEQNLSETNQIEAIFEKALQASAEQLIAYFATETKTVVNFSRINFLVGLIVDNNLFISQRGKFNAFLLYDALSGNRERKNRMLIDIIKNAKAEGENDELNHPLELFSNVINGNIDFKRSQLIFCNNDFLDYFSSDQIKQIASTIPIYKIKEYFDQILLRTSINTNFLAFFINFQDHQDFEPTQTVIVDNMSQDSMNDLMAKTKSTEKILSPDSKIAINKIISKLFREFIKFIKLIFGFLKKLPLKNILNIAGNGFKKAFSFVWLMGKKATAKPPKEIVNDLKSNIELTKKQTKEKTISTYKKILTFSPIQKALLAIAGIFILLFCISIATLYNQKQKTKEVTDYKSIVEQIIQKKDLAEASLIYNDEEKAKTLVISAQELLKKLPLNTADRRAQYEKLSDDIALVQAKVNHIYIIENPAVLFDLTNKVDNNTKYSLLLNNDNLLLYGNTNLYKLASTNPSKIDQINTQAKLTNITSVTNVDKNTLYVCSGDRDRLFSLNLTDSMIKPLAIKLSNEKAKIKQMVFYNGKLYIFDDINDQIYRYAPKNESFSAPYTWLKGTSNNIKDANNFTIDGLVYFSQVKNNKITKFSAGKKQELTVTKLEPNLQSIDKIWTDTDWKYLYILDKANKRIVIIDKKTGATKMQLTSEKFDNITDFAINEVKKELYILNNNLIYKISLKML